MKYTPGSIVSEGHVVLTGPITGTVELSDGTVVDVSPVIVEVSSQDEANELADLIGQRYAAEGHPDMVEADNDGNLVQREFVYVKPEDVSTVLGLDETSGD
jgi:hypothetical protein